MLDDLTTPATKKDLLLVLGVIALTVWLSDSKGVEEGVKQIRQRLGGLIAGKSAAEPE